MSLAIYIHGVAQELLRLVRASAPDRPSGSGTAAPLLRGKDLKGSAGVYRKLSQLRGGTRSRLKDVREEDPIRTRFVVDVLSGTSAGGINAVFLAKALANNQTMDGLRKLWREEGDLAKLINDARSVEGVRGLAICFDYDTRFFTKKRPYSAFLTKQNDI